MKEFYKKHSVSINQLITFFAVLILALLFFKYAFKVLAPFITAAVLAAIISRPVDYLSSKHRVPRALSTIVSMLIVISVIIVILHIAAKLLITQLVSFSASFPGTSYRVFGMLRDFQESYYNFSIIIPDDIREIADQSITRGISSATSWIANSAKSASLVAVKVIPKMFVFLIITLISTFFMTKDKKTITAFISRQIPRNTKNTIIILKKDIFGALWGYIKAQLILMSFSGVIATIGLTILGNEFSLLFGLAVAVFDALPIFGPGFILWPWAFLALIGGRHSFAIGLLVIYGIIMVCRQILEPKVLGEQIGLYPLVTLSALYIGLMVMGPAGLIAGPLLAIVIKSLQNARLLPGWK